LARFTDDAGTDADYIVVEMARRVLGADFPSTSRPPITAASSACWCSSFQRRGAANGGGASEADATSRGPALALSALLSTNREVPSIAATAIIATVITATESARLRPEKKTPRLREDRAARVGGKLWRRKRASRRTLPADRRPTVRPSANPRIGDSRVMRGGREK
jgi:hypothetical protein